MSTPVVLVKWKGLDDERTGAEENFRQKCQIVSLNLAEKADISITFLSNIERGNAFPKAGTLCSLANALDLEIWELFKGELTPGESTAATARFSAVVRQRINGVLDEIFEQK